MNTLNVGDRVSLLTNREGYDPIRIGSLGTITEPIDEDGDYDVLWDERYPREENRFAHSSTIELLDATKPKPGDRVRITTSRFAGSPNAPQLGDYGSISEPYLNSPGETLIDGYYFRDGQFEVVATPEVPAEKTYGEIIELALNRFNAGADILQPKDSLASMFTTQVDKDLGAALRVLVGGLVANPRGEKILRKLVGE